MAFNRNFILWHIMFLFINATSKEMSLSPHTFWNQTAVTVAGWENATNGSSPSQLNLPVGISISDGDVLYICDSYNHRIIVIHLISTMNKSIDSFGSDSNFNPFQYPYDAFVTNTSLYVTDYLKQQVQKLSLNGSDPTNVLHLNNMFPPAYLYMDNDDNMYLSNRINHTVLFFHANSTNFTMVAGNGTNGSKNDQLNSPYGVFVDHEGAIYVADSCNHRIMKWFPEARTGIILAGNGTAGASSSQLNHPTHVIVDENKYMYIAEAGNGRITRWAPNSTFGVCIAACTKSPGTSSTQLHGPHSLAFDSNGSLYVSDWQNHRVQKFQILGHQVSYNRPKICTNATWNGNGTTFANLTKIAHHPPGIFVDHNDSIYVTSYSTNEILVWYKGTVDPVKRLSVKIYAHTGLFVTMNGDIYFANGNESGQIDKWTINSNNSIFVRKLSGSCNGLFVDVHNNLYCSIRWQHQVVKVPLDDDANTAIIVAGTSAQGSALNQLDQPWGIFVDTNFHLYVADAANHRIVRFQPGETYGCIVAGHGTPLNLTLKFPTDVILDADGLLYIADNQHHRVIRVGHNFYQAIVGDIDQLGSSPDKLNIAYSLRFDSYGNLYVVDEFNYRIQKFDLARNSCDTSTTMVTTVESTTRSIPPMCQKQDPLVTTEQTTAAATSTASPSQPPSPFLLHACPKTEVIGLNCTSPNTPCDMLQPCRNNATCYNTKDSPGYNCSCASSFNGTWCELDHRPCKENTCWNNGICAEVSTGFNCTCAPGWEGTNCERKINYCRNITCENNGVCRPLLLNYSCECLGDSYSGRHCENTVMRIVILKIVSKSLAYVAILAMVSVAMFVVVMDILKYCFGIDPVEEERERIRRAKRAKKRKPVIQRFVCVNAPPASDNSVPAMAQTTV